jgi:hypothetical protein
VPSRERDTTAVAGGVAACGSFASIVIEGDNVCSDLECKEDSGDERHSATHCLGSKKTWEVLGLPFDGGRIYISEIGIWELIA